MLSIRTTTMGQDLTQLEKNTRAKIEKRIAGTLTASVNQWRKIVITSTWFSPKPSPTSLIIAAWRKVGGNFYFVHGWINYKGDQARADWRMSLRDWMFTPQMLRRIDEIMTPALGAVGGSDPGASGSGGQS